MLVPGSGTFGMEAVARQFANKEKVLIVRNGWFSFRWSQILMPTPAWAVAPWSARRAARAMARRPPGLPVRPRRWPPPSAQKSPRWCFAPHVETSSGIILSDDYIRTVSAAAHEVGALFVLDCIASGAMWVDMQATGWTF